MRGHGGGVDHWESTCLAYQDLGLSHSIAKRNRGERKEEGSERWWDTGRGRWEEGRDEERKEEKKRNEEKPRNDGKMDVPAGGA